MSALVCLVVLALCALAPALPITSLPGYHGPKLTMDSGYVTVKPGERALFYWMIQSTRSATDPVVFWFQGGPGCSSLYGMLGENGCVCGRERALFLRFFCSKVSRPEPRPFMTLANGSIGYRDLSWTNFATMVFTESPAGVGFSYSNNSAWNPTDSNTATDNYAFIQGFFQAHPQLASLPFWLAGESYGGMYVPTLADKITSNPASPLFSKFAGFMVGNPVFDCNESTNTNSFVDPFYWHGAVSYYDYNAWVSNGCGTDASSASCSDILNAISNGVGNSDQEAKKKRVVGASPLPSWDPDNLYQNFVTDNGTLSIVNSQPDDGSFEPVISDLMIAYLSKPSTQAAIHVAPFLGNVPWAPCAQVGYSSDIGSLVPFYKKIHAAKPSLKILVYSGERFSRYCLRTALTCDLSP